MTELARMIATKAVSPVEVVRAHLDRIAALDRDLRSYITVVRRGRRWPPRARPRPS
jgi:Asp-tRNA(Asn)/Glu-tRNA(Gln) amidotransferase A subunit family amidase